MCQWWCLSGLHTHFVDQIANRQENNALSKLKEIKFSNHLMSQSCWSYWRFIWRQKRRAHKSEPVCTTSPKKVFAQGAIGSCNVRLGRHPLLRVYSTGHAKVMSATLCDFGVSLLNVVSALGLEVSHFEFVMLAWNCHCCDRWCLVVGIGCDHLSFVKFLETTSGHQTFLVHLGFKVEQQIHHVLSLVFGAGIT